jgi:hypothetical protein
MDANGQNGNHQLSANEILDIIDVVIEPHPVLQWKGMVYVRSVSAQERGEIEAGAAMFKEHKGKDATFARDFTVRFAWLAMCDENGTRLFSKIEDVAKLKQKNAAAIASIAEHAQKLSGFSKQDMEELEKNSGKAEPEDSDSAWPGR